MRLDLLYALGSLFGGPTDSQVCIANPYAQSSPRTLSEVNRHSGPERAAAVTAFINVTVIPMDTERVLPNHTVLVAGGKITALGPANEVKVPAGALRIDGKGKYLMPGLNDMHAHLHMYFKGDDATQRYMFSYLANGVTGVRHLNTAGSLAETFLRFRSGEIFGPHIYMAPSMRELGETPLDSVATLAARYQAEGYDFISLSATHYTGMSPDDRTLYDSLLAAGRRLGLPPASHTNSESYEAMLAFGALGGSVEHLYPFRDTLSGPPESVSDAEIQAVAAETKRAGTWLDVTLDCVEERRKPPVIEVSRRLVKALQDAGVKLLLGADADMAHGRATSGAHEELAELIRAGLTPYQALAAGTRNVAEYFGKLEERGTVTVGKRADLVLLYGNPLEDIRYALEPAGVMIHDRWLDRAALDQGLLASPSYWFQIQVRGMLPPMSGREVGAHVRTFSTLIDSLEQAAAASDKSTTERLVKSLTDELGAIRGFLTPEQQEKFDPQARAWMREQARKGYAVTVAGVSPTP